MRKAIDVWLSLPSEQNSYKTFFAIYEHTKFQSYKNVYVYVLKMQ